MVPPIKWGGGKCLVGGSTYSIKEGKTLIGGTTKSIPFTKETPVSNGDTINFNYVTKSYNNTHYSSGSSITEWADTTTPLPFSAGPAHYATSTSTGTAGIGLPQHMIGSQSGAGPGGVSVWVEYNSITFLFIGPLNLAETPKITITATAAVVTPAGYYSANSLSSCLLAGYSTSVPTKSSSIYTSFIQNLTKSSEIRPASFNEYSVSLSPAAGNVYLAIAAENYNTNIATTSGVFIANLTLSN